MSVPLRPGSNIITLRKRLALAITLRWMASKLCAGEITWGAITAFEIEFPFEDETKWEQIAEGFRVFSHGIVSVLVLSWFVLLGDRWPPQNETLRFFLLFQF
jgi:hypothetical protein